MQICRVVGDIFWGVTPCRDPGVYKNRGPMKKPVNLPLERAWAKAPLSMETVLASALAHRTSGVSILSKSKVYASIVVVLFPQSSPNYPCML